MENQIKSFQNVQVSEVFQLHGVSDEIATEYDRQQEQIAIQNKIKRSEIPLVFQKGFTDFVVDTVERQNLLKKHKKILQFCLNYLGLMLKLKLCSKNYSASHMMIQNGKNS